MCVTVSLYRTSTVVLGAVCRAQHSAVMAGFVGEHGDRNVETKQNLNIT